jgi:gentisate 1,2-dioxygenase
MSFRAQMLRPGESTAWRRRMASTVYCVLEGEGRVELEGGALEWTRNDVFTVPGWSWSRFVNPTRKPVFLYSVTDEPTLRKLGLMREQGRTEAGAAIEVAQ